MTEPREEKCYTKDGILVCRCGKCEAEDYPLPADFPKPIVEVAALPKKEGEGWDWEALFDEKFPVISNNGDIGDAVTRQFINLTLSQSFLIKDFIRQHFISRTAVENMIEGLKKDGEWKGIIAAQEDEVYNQALKDLKEKIKKG